MAATNYPNLSAAPDEDVRPDIDQKLLLVCVHEVGHTIVDAVFKQMTAGCAVYRTEDGEWLGKTHAPGGERPTDRDGWLHGATAFFGGFAAVELAIKEGQLPPCPDGEEIERHSGYAGSDPWVPTSEADLQLAYSEGRAVSDKAVVEWCTWCGSGRSEGRDETVRTEALEGARRIVADHLSLIMELATELASKPTEHKELQADRILAVMVKHQCF